MSPDNVGVVQESLKQWHTPREELARNIVESWDPSASYYPVRKFPDSRPRHGHDEITEFFSGFREAWETVEFEVRRIVAVGDDRVLVQATMRAEGREARVELQGDIYQSVWLRNGLILRWEDHLTEAGALGALGVSRASLDTTGADEAGS